MTTIESLLLPFVEAERAAHKALLDAIDCDDVGVERFRDAWEDEESILCEMIDKCQRRGLIPQEVQS